jgi:hypothetical protein
MKKIFSLALCAFLVTLNSCSSDSDSSNNNQNSSSVTASIDGNSWASINGGAVANVVQMDGADGPETVLQIVATKADQTSLSLQFPITSLSVGTYTFNGSNFDEMGVLSYFSSGNFYSSDEDGGNFTVSITDIDLEAGTLSGTFSGTLVDFDGITTMTVTNGEMHNITMFSTDFYSNGSMTVTKDGGSSFTMDGNNEDGKFVMITQSTAANTIAVMGNNSNLDANFGIYEINFPKNVAPGTYPLEMNTAYSAGFSNSDNAQYDVTSGTLTITSHNGNTVIGTFQFNASNGSQSVSITNGSFEIEHN